MLYVPLTLTGLISETNSLNFILNAIDVKRGTIRFMPDICKSANNGTVNELSCVTTLYYY